MNKTNTDSNLLDRAVKKAQWRIIPCLIIMYLMSYLDRVNVSFAKEAYQASTGISDAAFAFGAGIFFLSYAFFELPSNLLMHRVGPRSMAGAYNGHVGTYLCSNEFCLE